MIGTLNIWLQRLVKILAMLFFFAKVTAQDVGIRVTYFNFNDTIIPEDKKYTTTVIISGNKSVSYKLPYEKKAPGMYQVSNVNGKQKYEFYSEADYNPKYVFKNFLTDSSFFQSEVGFILKKSEVYVDSLHPFAWTISKEVKKIGSQIGCKATMQFRGRNYTAWFDESVKISNGPWKFGGLPGLILQIYDDTFTVYWTISKLEYIGSVDLPEFPKGVTATFADFKKMYKEKFEKIKKSFESSDALSDPNCVSCKGSKKTITNNSVENILQE